MENNKIQNQGYWTMFFLYKYTYESHAFLLFEFYIDTVLKCF